MAQQCRRRQRPQPDDERSGGYLDQDSYQVSLFFLPLVISRPPLSLSLFRCLAFTCPLLFQPRNRIINKMIIICPSTWRVLTHLRMWLPNWGSFWHIFIFLFSFSFFFLSLSGRSPVFSFFPSVSALCLVSVWLCFASLLGVTTPKKDQDMQKRQGFKGSHLLQGPTSLAVASPRKKSTNLFLSPRSQSQLLSPSGWHTL